MKKVFPRNAGYVLLSVTILLILGACMKPVDSSAFGETASEGNTEGGVNVIIGFKNPNDNAPVLEATIGGTKSPVNKNETLKFNNTDTITVTNGSNYDSIEWYINETATPGNTGTTLTVDTGIPPFNQSGTYPVSVVGKKAGVLYDTLVLVNVGS